MKTKIAAIAGMSFLGLAYSASAMAELKPFYESSGDSYHCGYKNEAGKVVVPADKYQGCGEFSDGLAYVGHIAKPLVEYDSGGYKHVQGFIDKSGKLVIPVKYEVQQGMDGGDYTSFSNGFVTVFKNGKYGYMNKKQQVVVPHKYEYAFPFSDGVAVVMSDEGLFGVIDQTGKTLIPLKHNFIGSFNDGLAPVSTTNSNGESLYGYINKKGKFVIAPKFNDANAFSEGLAVVRVDSANSEKWGVIDKTGNFVVKPKYDEIIPRIETDAQEFDTGYYKNGKTVFYSLVSPNKPYDSKIIRSIVDKTGKVLSRKTYNNWDSAASELE